MPLVTIEVPKPPSEEQKRKWMIKALIVAGIVIAAGAIMFGLNFFG